MERAPVTGALLFVLEGDGAFAGLPTAAYRRRAEGIRSTTTLRRTQPRKCSTGQVTIVMTVSTIRSARVYRG